MVNHNSFRCVQIFSVKNTCDAHTDLPGFKFGTLFGCVYEGFIWQYYVWSSSRKVAAPCVTAHVLLPAALMERNWQSYE
jgi:hypothetical protein